MSPIEAICFELVKKFLDPLIPNKAIEPINAYFEEAKKVLAERQSDKYQKWSNKVQIVNEGFQLQPAKINANIISDIYDALWDGNVIECDYQSRNALEPKTYEYHPAGIVYRGRISYLVGAFEGSPDKVIYLPLHRFKKIKIIKEKYSIHRHAEIESLTGGLFGFRLNEKNISIQLKFSPSAGAHLLETPLSIDQKISFTKAGYISVKASVVDNMELRYWIRAFGNDVEVIKPISLRNDFIKMTNNLRELYEKN
jgi:predicted DNA-binding transcriptional regulator YafY